MIHARNRAACMAWLEWLETHGRKRPTLYAYGGKLEALCAFLGPTWLGDCDLHRLEAFIGRPRRGDIDASASTRSRDVIVLRGLYGYLKSHDIVPRDPSIDLRAPTVRNANPRAIDDTIWQQVWLSDEPTDAERVALGLGYFCGLRRAEVCALTVRHIIMPEGRIVDFPRKGDASDRATGVTPMLSCVTLFLERCPEVIGSIERFTEPLARLMGAHSQGDKGYLLPWGHAAERWRPSGVDPMTSPDQVSKRLMRLLVRCGLPATVFTFHALRHSFVTKLIEMGIPLHIVSRMANHSSPTVTMRYIRTSTDPLAPFLTSAVVGSGDRLGGPRW